MEANNGMFRSEYGNFLFAINDFEGAEKEFMTALNINPDNDNIWTNLGILYTNHDEPEKAEIALRKAISLNPNSSVSYINLMRLYKCRGKVAEARKVWEKYQKLDLPNLDINVMHLGTDDTVEEFED